MVLQITEVFLNVRPELYEESSPVHHINTSSSSEPISTILIHRITSQPLHISVNIIIDSQNRSYDLIDTMFIFEIR